MIEITFQAEHGKELLKRMQEFLHSFTSFEKAPEQTSSAPVVGQYFSSTTLGSPYDPTSVTTLTKPASSKKGPGRPPKNSKPSTELADGPAAKPSPAVENIKAYSDLMSDELVGAAGIEPATPIPKRVTREELKAHFQKLMEKENLSDPQKVAGMTRIREVLSSFGAASLGKLEEKFYPDAYQAVEEILAE